MDRARDGILDLTGKIIPIGYMMTDTAGGTAGLNGAQIGIIDKYLV